MFAHIQPAHGVCTLEPSYDMFLLYLQTMEEERDFVPDYDKTMPAEDSGEGSPVPSDTGERSVP